MEDNHASKHLMVVYQFSLLIGKELIQDHTNNQTHFLSEKVVVMVKMAAKQSEVYQQSHRISYFQMPISVELLKMERQALLRIKVYGMKDHTLKV